MQKNNNTIFLVTGGTGGHFFPALAVAQKDKEHKHIFIVDNRVKRNFEKFCRATRPLLLIKGVGGENSIF